MRQAYSAAIGIVGGVVDLAAGLTLLQAEPPMGENSMMTAAFNARLAGFLILALGVIVLVTGLYLLRLRMVRSNSMIGGLMLTYGAIMLILGVSMIGRLFSMMMAQAMVSGVAMLVLGVAMIYSGLSMAGSWRA